MVCAGVRHHEHTSRSPCRFTLDWEGTRKPLCSRRWATVYPATFTLDTQPPSVAIDASTLTISDTYQLGSGILRFHGTASDTAGLATVQVRVGDQPFSDATLDGAGGWYTALA